MEATSSRTGRPSGSSDILSDAWLCVGLRIIRKYKKTFTTKYILTGLSEWSTQAFHFMKPFLAMRKGGDSDCRNPVFLPPQTQSLTLKRYVFGGIQHAYVCSLTKVNSRAIKRQRWGLQQAILRLQHIE